MFGDFDETAINQENERLLRNSSPTSLRRYANQQFLELVERGTSGAEAIRIVEREVRLCKEGKWGVASGTPDWTCNGADVPPEVLAHYEYLIDKSSLPDELKRTLAKEIKFINGEFLECTFSAPIEEPGSVICGGSDFRRNQSEPANETTVEDEKFLRELAAMDDESELGSVRLRTLPQEQDLAPRKRIHLNEMNCVPDGQGGYRATNGGLYEIVINPPVNGDHTYVSVVSNGDMVGSVEDLRLLRNLLIDLDGFVFSYPRNFDRLEFWKWKTAVMQGILEHPAMEPGKEPVVIPDFDASQWEEDFLSGVTVEEAIEKADQAFNRGGW